MGTRIHGQEDPQVEVVMAAGAAEAGVAAAGAAAAAEGAATAGAATRIK